MHLPRWKSGALGPWAHSKLSLPIEGSPVHSGLIPLVGLKWPKGPLALLAWELGNIGLGEKGLFPCPDPLLLELSLRSLALLQGSPPSPQPHSHKWVTSPTVTTHLAIYLHVHQHDLISPFKAGLPSPFTDKSTKVQRVGAACPRSHSRHTALNFCGCGRSG